MSVKSVIVALVLAVVLYSTNGASIADSKSPPKPPPKPVALILSIDGDTTTALRPLDHLYEGTDIDLRPGGVLKISYLASCLEETITGGRVRFRNDSRKLRKGAKAESIETVCTTAEDILDKDERQAFEDVQGLSPFHKDVWHERIIQSSQPIFQWPMGLDVQQVVLQIIYLDNPDLPVVWETTSAANHLFYPPDAPALRSGLPYQIAVRYPGGTLRTNIFSIDPGLNIPDSVANRLVPLDW
jgi:hypothetical protein